MRVILELIATLGQFVLSFCAFWLVWRVLLPDLSRPADPDKRIAPYAGYFTDSFLRPIVRTPRISPRLVALIALGIAAA